MGYVSIECKCDKFTFSNLYVFRSNGVVVAQCDEHDYHDTIDELLAMGYSLSCCY